VAVSATGAGMPTTPLSGEQACFDAAGTPVSCTAGPVRSIEFTPAAALVPGAPYVATVAPPGSVPPTVKGLQVGTAASPAIRARVTVLASSLAIRYGWRQVPAPPAFGDVYQSEYQAGAVATFPFTGTGVTVITIAGPDQGKANLRIDGAVVDQINGYADQRQYDVEHAYTGLTNGPHVLKVRVLGKLGNPASTGTTFSLDALRILTPPSGWVLRRNPKANYGWRQQKVVPGTKVAQSSNNGATATLVFYGTEVTWNTVPTDSGTAKVFIDRVRSLYDGSSDQRVFGGLSEGRHKLVVKVASDDPLLFTQIYGFEVTA
jgi:hypothetical protein